MIFDLWHCFAASGKAQEAAEAEESAWLDSGEAVPERDVPALCAAAH